MSDRKGKRYSADEKQFLLEYYKLLTNAELAEILDRTEPSVQSQLVAMRLNRGKLRIWSAEEKAFLWANCQTMSHKELASALGMTAEQVKGAMSRYKINSGRTGKFTKGHRPWNHRRKGMAIGGIHTQFKKGRLPHNTASDGEIRLRFDSMKNGNVRPYYFIRLAKAKWEFLHRHLWIQAHGPIPKGMLIVFKDGNSKNCVIENLEMITKTENARRNYVKEKASRAARDLTDNYIAGRMAGGDKKLRKAIIHGAPELIELKRNQLILKRNLKNERDNKA